jgi:hypothetical protein
MKKVWWYAYGADFARQIEGLLDMQFGRGIAARISGVLRSAGVIGRKRL